MVFVTFLIIFPIVAGLLMAFLKSHRLLAALVLGSSVVVAVSSVLFTVYYWQGAEIDTSAIAGIPYAVIFAEVLIALFIIFSGIRAKKFLVSGLSLAQLIILLGYELIIGHNITGGATYVIDRLSLLMVLIIGIISSLIYIFTIKYIQDYHINHPEVKDRRNLFFSVLFIFTGVMFGLVLANQMTLMLLFWEITTLASFILIGYTNSREAVDNAFLALTTNVFGGLLFTLGIVVAGAGVNVGDFQGLLAKEGGDTVVTVAVFLFACAGLAKAAQMPFSKWLLGAMVALTPASAILHSSTMVKAGVYLPIRLAPLMGLNAAGITITAIGCITFLTAAMMAISQKDAKRILAYSTISNLGLIVACAGINTAGSIWAAIMLIIFHAVAKSLLFLTVGATEHCIGSKNVENMDGLFKTSPVLAILLITGIMGMFLAPFGILISKWAAMKAFLDFSGPLINVAILLAVAVGSTITFFYWTKWLGKLIAETVLYKPDENSYKLGIEEKVSLYSHAAMVVLLCMIFPLISKYFVIPYISGTYEAAVSPIRGVDAALIMLIMSLLFILIVAARILYGRFKGPVGSVYMAGVNTSDNRSYHGGMGRTTTVSLSNWYLNDIFGEKIWFAKAQALSAALLLVGFIAVIGGFSL